MKARKNERLAEKGGEVRIKGRGESISRKSIYLASIVIIIIRRLHGCAKGNINALSLVYTRVF